jgi:hypothetical protein
MLLTEIVVDTKMEQGEGILDPGWSPLRLSQETVTVQLRFVVESTDSHVAIDPTPEGVIELIQGCKTPQSPTGSSSGSSVDPPPPNIVVSLRPKIDGAPSVTQVMAPGMTNVVPLDLLAVMPNGQLVQLNMGIEVRTALSPTR